MAIDRIRGVNGSVGAVAGNLLVATSALQAGRFHTGLDRRDEAMGLISREEIDQAAEELNRMLQQVNQRLSFRVHEGTERMMVYVIDNETNEVIREMPPEKFLDTIAKIREFVGLLIDEWF